MITFLDLDGVTADFNLGIVDAHINGEDERAHALARLDNGDAWEDVFGMSTAEVWRGLSSDFWVDLPEVADRHENMPRLVRLYDALSAVSDAVYILTALPYGPAAHAADEAASGKIQWVRKRLGAKFGDIILTSREGKRLLAGVDRVLIDDLDRNCTEWCDGTRGGAVRYVPLAGGCADVLGHIVSRAKRAARLGVKLST